MRPDNSLLKDLALVCTHLSALKGKKKTFHFPVPGKSCPTFTRGEGKPCVGRTGIVSSPLCPQDTIGLKSKRRFSWKCSTLLLSKTNQAVGLRGQDFTLGDSRPARHQHSSSRPPPAL